MIKPRNKSGKVEYRRPINISDDTNQNIELLLIMYTSSSNSTTLGKYEYCEGDMLSFSVWNVIMGVEMTIDDDGLFILSADDKRDLLQYVAEEQPPKTEQWLRRQCLRQWTCVKDNFKHGR